VGRPPPSICGGRISELKRGNRAGCDQSIWSEKAEVEGFRWVGTVALLRLKEGRDFRKARREVVRLDLKEERDFLVDTLVFGADRRELLVSLSSSEGSGVGPKGWSKVVSSVMTCERALSRLYEWGDLGLRNDSGVAGLPNEDTDRSSASSEGTLSLDVDRVCNNPFSVALPSGLKVASSPLSHASSSSTLRPGLLLRLDVFRASSFFHSLTSSSMDMRRCSRLLRLN